jgi:hypothetical protein
MKHFIITRFNVKFDDWITDRNGAPVLTENWLVERFDLFRKFCFPSVTNQTNKNFYWVIYFDVNTSTSYRNEISELIKGYSNYELIYVDGIKSLIVSFVCFIKSKLDHNDDYIITSRLDNDDSIHQDYVDTIQKLARKEDGLVIDVRKGYQIDVSSSRYEFRNYYKRFNPFISLVEKSTDFKTVISKRHKDWKDMKSIIIYQESALWIEIIHQRNKKNRVRHNIPLIGTINLKEFGIKYNHTNKNRFSICFNNLLLKINSGK